MPGTRSHGFDQERFSQRICRRHGLDFTLNTEFDEITAIKHDGITGEVDMAKKAKKSVGKKTKAKKPAKKKVAAKKTAKKTYSVKAAKKTARAFVKAAGKKTSAVRKSGTKLVRRAIKAVADVAAPIIPGGETKN
jgi:hypothetical protein